MLTTQLITNSNDLASLRPEWNALAEGMPFRAWNWLATWWEHYGSGSLAGGARTDHELRVVAVYAHTLAAEAELVGIAPWYMDRNVVQGNVLRPLASGEVCSDHLSLICRPERTADIASVVADYLTTSDDEWDRLELPAVDADDAAIAQLTVELTERECITSRRPADRYWVVDLPETWDEYLAKLSKSHRKQLRQCERRVLASGRVQWHTVGEPNDLERAWNVLVDLHQRRRRSLNEPGCFASRPFHDFHRNVVEQLLASGQLRMSWLELDGTPAAAEYHLAGTDTTYAYQGGVDPERLSEEPGRLSTVITLQRAIEEGHRWFDFMRGDEPYKAHWRAVPREAFDHHIVPNRHLAKLRGRVLEAAGNVSDWMKHGVDLVTG